MEDLQRISDRQVDSRYKDVSYFYLDGDLVVSASSEGLRLSGRKAEEVLDADTVSAIKDMTADSGANRIIADCKIQGDQRLLLVYRLGYRENPFYHCYPITKGEGMAEQLADAAQLETVQDWRQLLDSMPIAAAVTTEDKIKYCNTAFSDMTGYTPAMLYSMNFSNIIGITDKQAVADAMAVAEKDEPGYNSTELTIRSSTGKRDAIMYMGSLHGPEKRFLSVFLNRGRKDKDSVMIRILADAISSVGEAICVFDREWNLKWCNQLFKLWFGENGAASNVFPEGNAPELEDDGEIWHGFGVLNSAHGVIYAQINVSRFEEEYFCVNIKDMTDAVDKEKLLDNFRTTDYLTGADNSVHFRQRLNADFEKAEKEGLTLNLVMFTMANYSDIFFVMGDQTADALLKNTALRATSELPEGSHMGRLGESEFGVVFFSERDVADSFIRDFMAHMDAPEVYKGESFYPKIYAGICSYPGDVDSVQVLYSNAMNVLHNAIASSSLPAFGYLDESGAMKVQRYHSSFEHNVRSSIKGNDFYMEYQPIFDIGTNEPVMLAALLRTKTPLLRHGVNRGFILSAEATGAMLAIGSTTLEQVAEYQMERIHSYRRFLPILFNLSYSQLQDSELLEFCERILCRYGLPRKSIMFQVSANDLRSHRTECLGILFNFTRRGFAVSIGGLKGGVGSLPLPAELKPDTISVYIGSKCDDTHDDRFADSKMVAVGVETAGQLEMAKKAGFDYYQGFLNGKVMGKDMLEF